jgi:hypothetical protein
LVFSSTGRRLCCGSVQGSAVVVEHLDAPEDMAAAARGFDAMDDSEMPRTRLGRMRAK